MTKDDALRHYGDISTPEGRAAAVSALTSHLKISRAAFYQWPEDQVPKLRQFEIEQHAAAQAVKAQLAAAHPTVSPSP